MEKMHIFNFTMFSDPIGPEYESPGLLSVLGDAYKDCEFIVHSARWIPPVETNQIPTHWSQGTAHQRMIGVAQFFEDVLTKLDGDALTNAIIFMHNEDAHLALMIGFYLLGQAGGAVPDFAFFHGTYHEIMLISPVILSYMTKVNTDGTFDINFELR
jgi:hypothetical protein